MRPSVAPGRSAHEEKESEDPTCVKEADTQFTTVMVRVPMGMRSGQQLQIRAPDASLHMVTIPGHISEGETFSVCMPHSPKAQMRKKSLHLVRKASAEARQMWQ